MDLFGQAGSKQEFEWPDEKTVMKSFPMDVIPATRRVHLWIGRTPNPFLTHIALDLNNGESSPEPISIFDQRMDPQAMKKFEIDVDPTKQIKHIKLKTRLIGGLFYVKGIEFTDPEGK